MPTGLTLSANMGAPAGATSAGTRPLTTTAIDSYRHHEARREWTESDVHTRCNPGRRCRGVGLARRHVHGLRRDLSRLEGMIPTARLHRRAVALFATVFVVTRSHSLVAQQDAVQFRVAAGSLVVNTAVAGSPPTSVSTSTGMYRVKVQNGSTKQIKASINSALPPGVTMTVTVVAPPGATSVGPASLTTTPQTVVTNVTNNAFSPNLTITYTLSATSPAGVVAASNKTVTLTVTP